MKKWLVGVAMAMVWIAASGTGCDEAETAFDCQSVCSRYQSCFDDDYDVSSCRDRCRDKADDDRDWQNKADACAACIDDRSCSEATFNCLTECAGIVP